MRFDSLKASFTSKKRRQPSTAFSDIPFVRYEDTPQATVATAPRAVSTPFPTSRAVTSQETTTQVATPQPPIMKSRSLRAILLPGVPTMKPLSVSCFLNFGRSPSSKNMVVATEVSKGLLQFDEDLEVVLQRAPRVVIKRKPVGLDTVTDPRSKSYVPSFDPQAPRKDASLHFRARRALIMRYKSKFTVPDDFVPYEGTTILDYVFLWVQPGELEKKVLEDIVWVRECFAYARKSEPTDEDIIHWYDAQCFDDGYAQYWFERQYADEQYIDKIFIARDQNQAREEAEVDSEEDEADSSSIKVNVDDSEYRE